MGVGVVEVDDVDAIEPKALEAFLDRAQYPVSAEVPDSSVCRSHLEAPVVCPPHDSCRFQEPPHFRREHVFITRTPGERRPEAMLREA